MSRLLIPRLVRGRFVNMEPTQGARASERRRGSPDRPVHPVTLHDHSIATELRYVTLAESAVREAIWCPRGTYHQRSLTVLGRGLII